LKGSENRGESAKKTPPPPKKKNVLLGPPKNKNPKNAQLRGLGRGVHRLDGVLCPGDKGLRHGDRRRGPRSAPGAASLAAVLALALLPLRPLLLRELRPEPLHRVAPDTEAERSDHVHGRRGRQVVNIDRNNSAADSAGPQGRAALPCDARQGLRCRLRRGPDRALEPGLHRRLREGGGDRFADPLPLPRRRLVREDGALAVGVGDEVEAEVCLGRLLLAASAGEDLFFFFGGGEQRRERERGGGREEGEEREEREREA